jgi:hypothetical protein
LFWSRLQLEIGDKFHIREYRAALGGFQPWHLFRNAGQRHKP